MTEAQQLAGRLEAVGLHGRLSPWAKPCDTRRASGKLSFCRLAAAVQIWALIDCGNRF